MIIVSKYNDKCAKEWDDFVDTAKNSTFLFKRGFMDYHSDRFIDYSLMVYNKQKLVALLPLNLKHPGTVISHEGLSYGGLIVGQNERSHNFFIYFKETLQFLNKYGISRVIIKEIPFFYTNYLSYEQDYLTYILKAVIIRKDLSTTIITDNQLKLKKLHKRQISKALKENLNISEADQFESFWDEILTPNLLSKFGKKPVHSIDEIKLLKNRFPENIKQFNLYDGEKIIAGCTIFETENVAHTQYLSTNEYARNIGGLHYLIHHLISDVYPDKKYFDFGISTEENGNKLNNGLLEWKEGFGARSTVHNFYEIETNNYYLIDKLLND